MKKLYFYKDSNNKKNYCGWLFFRESLLNKKKNFINYDDVSFSKNNLISKKYEKIIFNYLYKRLNKFHNIDYPKRYWKILIHNWVKFYVNSIIFRYDYIKKNIEISKIKNFYFKFNSKYYKLPKFTSDFLDSLDDNDFNNRICYQIADTFNQKKNIKIQKKTSNYILDYKLKYNLFKFSITNNFLKPFFNFFLKFLIRENKPILVSTYLPKKIEYKYLIKNLYFFLWKNFFDINNYKINKIVEKNNFSRDGLFKKFKEKNLKSILFNLLDDCFPSCYLEDFSSITKYTKDKIIKKKIKYVFTSNEFALNDFFKFYLVELLAKGTKYFVGQHGSGYGSNIDRIDTIEELTSDKFFTWGWKYRKNHHPIGILQNIDKRPYKISNNINKILIVHPNLEKQRFVYNDSFRYEKSIQVGQEIIKICKENNFKNIVLRFHHEDYDYLKKNKKLYSKYYSGVRIDNGRNRISNKIDDNTLVIFTYFSSGFLELTSLNCKCLSIFNLDKKFFHPKFHNRIKLLEKDKIIFNKKKILSKHVKNLIKKDELYFKKNKISKYQKIFLKDYGNITNIKNKLESIL